MTWTIELPGVIPFSMNQRERMHHFARKKELDDLIVLIGWHAKALKIPAATSRRAVSITIHKSMRSRVMDDPANLPSRAKSVLDALTRTELLIDDNHRWLQWGGVEEGEKRTTKATVITISDVVDQEAA